MKRDITANIVFLLGFNKMGSHGFCNFFTTVIARTGSPPTYDFQLVKIEWESQCPIKQCPIKLTLSFFEGDAAFIEDWNVA